MCVACASFRQPLRHLDGIYAAERDSVKIGQFDALNPPSVIATPKAVVSPHPSRFFLRLVLTQGVSDRFFLYLSLDIRPMEACGEET